MLKHAQLMCRSHFLRSWDIIIKYDAPQSSLSYHLHNGVRGSSGNTALVALVAGHHDVALVTPAGSPRVLDNPVVLARLVAIANSQDTMVQVLGGAHRLIVDALLVELERVVAGINSDGDGANSADGVLKIGLGASLDINKLGQGATRVGRVVLADTITSGVGVLEEQERKKNVRDKNK